MLPEISVVMASYNCQKDYLKKSIESILTQSDVTLEFIIVDDCSTVKVKNIILDFNDNRIFLYRNKKNLGLTKSLNIGIKLAKSEFIARMDDDDISEKNRLKIQLDFLKSNREFSVVGSFINIIGKDGRLLRKKYRPTNYEDIRFYCFKNNPLCHSSAMFSKLSYESVGGYNGSCRYAQDYDLWTRFISKGYKIANIPEFLINWRENPEGISRKKVGQQTCFADTICLNYFREMLPEVKDIPDNILKNIRHKRYGLDKDKVKFVIDKLILKYKCNYSEGWYEGINKK